MIRNGHFLEGEQIPSERELMTLFQVGRPSIREALTGLHRKGYLVLKNGERARVTKPCFDNLVSDFSGIALDLLHEPEGMQEFEQVRIFVEQGLVRHAASHATLKQLKLLKEILEANRNSIGSPETFFKTDIAFHRTLAEISENRFLISTYKAMLHWMITSRNETIHVTEQQRSFDDHEKLYQALLSRDPELSSKVITQHLGRWCKSNTHKIEMV